MERQDEGMPFLLRYENVAWYEDGKVTILDRRVFPRQRKFVVCDDYHGDGIRTAYCRGAQRGERPAKSRKPGDGGKGWFHRF